MKNPKVVGWSLIALVFMFLTFTVNWLFIIPAAIISWMNYRALAF